MKNAILAVLFLTLAGTAQAGPHLHLVRFIKSHKQVFVADGIDFTAGYFDAHSSTLCQPNCVEESSILPPHPTTGQFMAVGIGTAGLEILYNHLMWHFAPSDADREVFLWGPTGLIAGNKAWAIKGNYDNQ